MFDDRGSGRRQVLALVLLGVLLFPSAAWASSRDEFPGRRCAPGENGGVSCTK